MGRYLVIHTPGDRQGEIPRPPSDLVGLAKHHGGEQANPRWIHTWSPELGDDRIFSLWDARNAAEIQAVLDRFGFLDTMDFLALFVREWGPFDVLKTQGNEN